MRKLIKSIIAIVLIVQVLLFGVSCNSNGNPDFKITFIDVGQGDAALVSCEGHHMLIDGGPKGAGEKVKNTLEDNKATKLDYLIISHMHEDHIGGLQKALSYVSTVDKALSNDDDDDSKEYLDFHKELLTDDCSSIDIPAEGAEFKLGSAIIKIIAVGEPNKDNDSLVVLITYGSTTFLFTGDMQYQMEDYISNKYNDNFPVTLLKVAHHGAENSTEYRFVRTTKPKYAVVSVGAENRYGHPTEKVLSVLDDAEVEVYRTDECGNITVTSDGKQLKIKTEK